MPTSGGFADAVPLMDSPRELLLFEAGETGQVQSLDPTNGVISAPLELPTSPAYLRWTLLPHDRVLFVGDASHRGAWVLDTQTWSISATGSTHYPVSQFTLTTLGDGRVLLTGGIRDAVSAQTTYTAEIWAPGTGRFTLTRHGMMSARWNDSTAVLRDGRVLVMGGLYWEDSGATTLGSAEIYDPTTGLFTRTGSMTPRVGALAVTLSTGKVFVAGGANGDCARQSSACTTRSVDGGSLFDPKTGKFTTPDWMPAHVAVDRAEQLADGRLFLCFASDADTSAPSRIGYYDPVSDTLESTDDPVDGETYGLADGSIFVVAPGQDRIGGTWSNWTPTQ